MDSKIIDINDLFQPIVIRNKIFESVKVINRLVCEEEGLHLYSWRQMQDEVPVQLIAYNYTDTFLSNLRHLLYSINVNSNSQSKISMKNNKERLDRYTDCFCFAIENGNADIVEFMIYKCKDLIDYFVLDNYGIKWAAEKGHLEVVQVFVGFHKKNYPYSDVIICAAKCGHSKVLDYLLKEFPNEYTERALAKAVKYDHKQVIEVIALNGYNTQQSSLPPY